MSSPDSTMENGHSLTLDSGVSVLSDQVDQEPQSGFIIDVTLYSGITASASSSGSFQ